LKWLRAIPNEHTLGITQAITVPVDQLVFFQWFSRETDKDSERNVNFSSTTRLTENTKWQPLFHPQFGWPLIRHVNSALGDRRYHRTNAAAFYDTDRMSISRY
jgi:hypothetical protein